MKNKHWAAKIKRKLTKHRKIVRGTLALIIIGLFILAFYTTIPPTLTAIKTLVKGPTTAFSLIKNPEEVLRSTRGRTNILLLGIGGTNHQGADLTDSIIVASVDLKSAQTILLSIPRDIWIDSLKTKLNSTYYYGELKQDGGGIILAKSAVEEVIGQPVHYAVVLNFSGFMKAVDLVGGIEIDVLKTFDDYKYPIPGMETAEPEELRYEHLHFEKGIQKMSGERALKYVRSRNAEGEEGSDFARSKRQQQVLSAFKQKILSRETIFSLTKVRELAQTFSDSVETDLQEKEYLSLGKLALKAQDELITSKVLETEDEEKGTRGVLVNPPTRQYQGQWVLIGRDGGWEEVHQFIESLFFPAN